MELSISWIFDGRPDWAPATGAFSALRQVRLLDAAGAQKVEVKDEDGTTLSRADLEKLASNERAARAA